MAANRQMSRAEWFGEEFPSHLVRLVKRIGACEAAEEFGWASGKSGKERMMKRRKRESDP